MEIHYSFLVMVLLNSDSHGYVFNILPTMRALSEEMCLIFCNHSKIALE